MNERDKKGCPKCGSRSIVGTLDIAEVFKKRGSKLVRKRGVEYAVFDNVCELCGHKWSALECIKGVPIRLSPDARI